MKIRTIIAATCAALAISMAGPVSAHDGETETVTKNFEAAIPQYSRQVADRPEADYSPARLRAPHPREVGFHLRSCRFAIESKVNGETRLSGRRELVRTAGRYPFDQPQREQDRAGSCSRSRPRHQ